MPDEFPNNLRLKEHTKVVRKCQKNPKISWNYSLVPSVPPRMNFFINISKKLVKKKKLNFACSALFHIKTKVCLKYFVNGCRILDQEKYITFADITQNI